MTPPDPDDADAALRGDAARRIAIALVGFASGIFASALAASAVSSFASGVTVLLVGQVAFWSVLVTAVRMGTSATSARHMRVEPRWFDLPIGAAAGVATQLLVLPLVYLPFQNVIDEEELSRPAEELLDGVSGVGLVLLGVGLVVVAPIVEEFFFRGLLMGALRDRLPTAAAVGVSSAVFGATHFQPLQFLGLAVAGAVFAMAAVVGGRLAPAIIVHAAFNAVTFGLLVFG